MGTGGDSRLRWVRVSVAIVFCTSLVAAVVRAQGVDDSLGSESRANAARDLIVLAVQQAISSLPPTSGQSFIYQFDVSQGTWVPTELMNPTSFRVPQTIGKGVFSLRAAVSYFDLDDAFGPATYEVVLDDGRRGFTKFGLDVSAQVGILNLAMSYGVSDVWELMFNLPIVLTDVSASQSFVVRVSELNTPLTSARLTAWPTLEGLNERLNTEQCLTTMPPSECLTFRRATMTDLDEALRANGFGGLDFDEGTTAGVGRMSLGAKRVVHRQDRFELALMGEFFAPSPSEAQFAGSNSAAILPRVVGAAKLTDVWRLHSDVGYDFDFDDNQLRRFVWNVGTSAALARVTVDFGFGGSKYNEGVTWTPDQANIGDLQGVQIGTIQIVDENQLGDNFVDFLGGIKVRLTEKSVLSGAVNVPITGDGFRPAAVGTLAFEYYM